jgi:hypothetical protein
MMDSTPSGIIKQEQQPQGIIQPPPSYQELSAVRRPVQLQTNPLLRQLGSPQLMSQLKMNSRFIKSLQLLKNYQQKFSLSGVQPDASTFCTLPQSLGPGTFQWNPSATAASGQLMGGAVEQQFIGHNQMAALPVDLENVNVMPVDQSLLTDFDVEVLRRELAQGGQFDLP